MQWICRAATVWACTRPHASRCHRGSTLWVPSLTVYWLSQAPYKWCRLWHCAWRSCQCHNGKRDHDFRSRQPWLRKGMCGACTGLLPDADLSQPGLPRRPSGDRKRWWAMHATTLTHSCSVPPTTEPCHVGRNSGHLRIPIPDPQRLDPRIFVCIGPDSVAQGAGIGSTKPRGHHRCKDHQGSRPAKDETGDPVLLRRCKKSRRC